MITGKAWFFRDKLGQLFMSTLEPVKNDDIISGGWHMSDYCTTLLCDKDKHLDITYENSPQLLDISINNKKTKDELINEHKLRTFQEFLDGCEHKFGSPSIMTTKQKKQLEEAIKESWRRLFCPTEQEKELMKEAAKQIDELCVFEWEVVLNKKGEE
jgi:hypothetical protein